MKLLFPVAGVIQKKSPGQITVDGLLQLPEHTFGHKLGEHMRNYKLDFIPGFEEHDMKHLLLGYAVSVPGEIRLSAFEFGTGNRSFMTLSVFLLGIPIAMDLWPQMIEDFREGKKNKSFRKLQLKKLILSDFENLYRITPKNPLIQDERNLELNSVAI